MSRLEGCRRCEDVGRCDSDCGGEDILLRCIVNRLVHPCAVHNCRAVVERQMAIEDPMVGICSSVVLREDNARMHDSNLGLVQCKLS
jgi:hypothetical protein